MPTLDRRIERLEQIATPEITVDTIIIEAMHRGPSVELQHLHTSGGAQQWSRLPNETEDDFTSRAKRELDRQGRAVVMLFSGMGPSIKNPIGATNVDS